MSTKGIDVSVWNGTIDFAKVKKAGIEFVIIRSGYGRLASQKDTRFESYYAGAKKAGLKIGSYWYSYAHSVAEARLEAKACLACIKGKSFDLPIYFDMEEGSQFSLGYTAVTNMALAFCEEIEKAGYKAGVYSNTNWFSNVLSKKTIQQKGYSIWHAQWSSSAVTNCDVWQYADNGKVSGISGNVDMNVCYTSFGASKPAATTKPTTTKKKTNEQIAQEVIDGKWGNGDDRKKKLTEAGYSYAEVQALVNKKLGATTAAKPAAKKIKVGGKVKVKNPVIYGTTKKFTVYYDKYDVLEVSGDRVVIGIGKDVTAAVKASNLEAV